MYFIARRLTSIESDRVKRKRNPLGSTILIVLPLVFFLLRP